MKSLVELAEEYKKNIEDLTAQCSELEKRYKAVSRKGADSTEAYKLSRNITVIESMIEEQTAVYAHLKSYYEE